MNLPNKHIVSERFSKSKETYKQHAHIQKVLCERFAATLFDTSIPFNRVLEVGCGTGFLTEQIFTRNCPQMYVANDIAQSMQCEIASLAKKYQIQNFSFLSGDAEIIDFPNQLDAIVSTSTIQWFHNVPEFFKKVSNSLNSEGTFAFSTFGIQNFIEIRETLGKGLEYISAEQIRKDLELYFEIQSCHEWTEKLWFDSPLEVLQHIKKTGVSGFAGTYFGKKNLEKFAANYKANYTENNKVSLTYHPIMFIAKKK